MEAIIVYQKECIAELEKEIKELKEERSRLIFEIGYASGFTGLEYARKGKIIPLYPKTQRSVGF